MVSQQDKQVLFFEKARIIEVTNFYGTNETTLRKLFSKHGPIASIILVQELHQAFVTFYSFGAAEASLKESDKWKINGKMIKVTRPELFHALCEELGSLVKVVAGNADAQEGSTPAASNEAQQNGNAKKRNNKKKGKRGAAASTEEDATAQPQKDEKPKKEKKAKKQKPRLTQEQMERAVYVSGPYALMKKQALKEFFKEVGNVETVVLGFKQRYAFVVFENKSEATQGCNLDDMEYNGHPRKVKVNMANSKPEKKEEEENETTESPETTETTETETETETETPQEE
uniref:RRM domain-containing protein n=1 Tax=Percolomonas cosmopolitus TaxID=63605 RepID=A0A7S1KPH7_9EUKA|eukprot:CAMPEP_0117444880 /NCGR_PEP_ID=MMETSP0759-20121206/5489_1 /TAXON_ID=63605 /ORGANISM="Percolomonas cosmopolitus, Strain WS" /LENGTH=286 /DNA_ID=CAMNT_0005237001 /DNA_START=53 /DNA_END=913 /DNA_ORIENTATION=+